MTPSLVVLQQARGLWVRRLGRQRGVTHLGPFQKSESIMCVAARVRCAVVIIGTASVRTINVSEIERRTVNIEY